MIVTQIVELEQTPYVVTRIVEQTVTPMATAVSNLQEVERPIMLDISIVGDERPVLNPLGNPPAATIDLIENTYIGLTQFNPVTQQVEQALAESWESSENGRVWTFTLRDDIFWVKPTEPNQDGIWDVESVAPVVAEDVVYTVQQACQKETGLVDVVVLFIIDGCEVVQGLDEAVAADLAQIGVKALDERTVQFTLNVPSAYFLTITSLWYLRPLPKEYIESFEDANEWLQPDNLITSGPFIPIPNRRSLQRNPVWPMDFLGNVDFVNYFLVEERDNQWQLWESKRIDYYQFVGAVPEQQIEEVEEDKLLIPEQTLFYLGYNFDSGAFREPEVRRAFSAAIDRQALVDALYEGDAFGMRHLMPEGVFGALPVEEVGMGYDPDYARIQMAESGFGTCALMPPITFLVNSSDLSLLQAEIIREMWIEELGCMEEQIVIEQAQFGTVLANTRSDAGGFRPDIWELGWASFYPDAHSWMGLLLHCAESENRPNRPCTQLDEQIRLAAAEVDVEQRQALYREIEMALFSRGGLAPIVPLYTPAQSYLIQPWLQLRLNNFGGQRFDLMVIDETLKRLEQSRTQ